MRGDASNFRLINISHDKPLEPSLVYPGMWFFLRPDRWFTLLNLLNKFALCSHLQDFFALSRLEMRITDPRAFTLNQMFNFIRSSFLNLTEHSDTADDPQGTIQFHNDTLLFKVAAPTSNQGGAPLLFLNRSLPYHWSRATLRRALPTGIT